jgi:very-short-patch-repair endonuclease
MSKTEEDILNDLAHEVAEVAADNYRQALAATQDRCESPIERLMLAAFLARPLENCEFIRGDLWSADRLLVYCWSGSTDWVGSIHPQVELGDYRVDFYLQAFVVDNWEGPSAKISGRWLQLVIECDGHNYHERTKEQARRDKRRDRWFQTHGISVLRFTRSKIWADPLGCVDQVHDAFLASWNRRRVPS